MRLPVERAQRILTLSLLLLAYFLVRFVTYSLTPDSALLEILSWLLLVFPVGFAAITLLEYGAAATAILIVAGNIAIREVLGVQTNLELATIWVSWGASLVAGALLGHLARITAALRERNERLLTTMREANHRIRNGLALAKSVVSLEKNTIEGSDAVGALNKVSSRIDAIATLHDELLWKREDRTVNLPSYLRRIVEQLREVLDLEIEESFAQENEITVDSEVAVGIALITNELLTNMAKHDLTSEGAPHPSVTLRQTDGNVQLTVASDRGTMPEQLGESERGLGTRIVDLLVEQSHGNLKTVSSAPPVFELSVPIGSDQA
ncbi:MAG: sensor histidine kinase [Spirochaetaceae bacterium]